MSEHYPLLCDELSEEDHFSPHFHRRLLMSRARARNHVKGAAAIITRWPDHWTTLLTYWWIGITMIAVTTFFIYNSLFSYAMFQETTPTNKLLSKPIVTVRKPITKEAIPLYVYMHLFVSDKNEIDLNNYLSYIEIIANKYTNLNYDLIIVANDTNIQTRSLSDEENNKLALNMLLDEDFNHKNLLLSNGKINIKYVYLSQYLTNSPLKKHWKKLPYQFIKFLVRAISIWEKGGVAFDPMLLTPQSPNSVYIDKIHNILKNFNTKEISVKKPIQEHYIPTNKKVKNKPIVNNIRDIINVLEKEDSAENTYQDSLVEAETENNATVRNLRRLLAVTDLRSDTTNQIKPTKKTEIKDLQNKVSDEEKLFHKDTLDLETTKDMKNVRTQTKSDILPLFIDFLYHNTQTKLPEKTTTNTVPNLIYNEHKDIEKNNVSLKNQWSEIKDRDSYKPIIISAKKIVNQSIDVDKPSESTMSAKENLFEVTIDLKGNIIATDTACHSFVGGIFSNAIYHGLDESVADFIIKELSIFCKGMLASCVGIDVILL